MIILNWVVGIGILGLLIGMVAAPQRIFSTLGIPHSWEVQSMMTGLRAIGLLGLAGIPLNYGVLRRLQTIIGTVRRGDPFIPTNAYRLQEIAWFLLALQLLTLVIGIVGKGISTKTHPIHVNAGFSPSGWLAVILMFILARVFAQGALMREDLDGTV
jgi:hypothetical protein